jgi:peptidoglycan/xylan/chitin deacetylase (PgdA/CDA1 family)
MRFFYTPRWLQWLQPQSLWRGKGAENKVYLTFDDGPIPEVTPFVLETLAQFQAKATFFCVGDNVRKHPTIFQQIIEAGHRVGNHTYNHLNGWKTDTEVYLENVAQCQQYLPNTTPFFRPPYGKLTYLQAKKIRQDYKIVMWNVLTYDFDATLAPETCLQKVQQYTKAGAIIVFHDSLKAERNLRYTLPRFLAWAVGKGLKLDTL